MGSLSWQRSLLVNNLGNTRLHYRTMTLNNELHLLRVEVPIGS